MPLSLFIFGRVAQKCSKKKGVPKNFAKFTGKHQCQSLLFNKVAGLRSATFLEKRLWHSCFFANFAKLLRIPILKNISERLLPVADWRTRRNRTAEIYCF